MRALFLTIRFLGCSGLLPPVWCFWRVSAAFVPRAGGRTCLPVSAMRMCNSRVRGLASGKGKEPFHAPHTFACTHIWLVYNGFCALKRLLLLSTVLIFVRVLPRAIIRVLKSLCINNAFQSATSVVYFREVYSPKLKEEAAFFGCFSA